MLTLIVIVACFAAGGSDNEGQTGRKRLRRKGETTGISRLKKKKKTVGHVESHAVEDGMAHANHRTANARQVDSNLFTLWIVAIEGVNSSFFT